MEIKFKAGFLGKAWVLKDDRIEIGKLFKEIITLDRVLWDGRNVKGDGVFSYFRSYENTYSPEAYLKCWIKFVVADEYVHKNLGGIDVKLPRSVQLYFRPEQKEDADKAVKYIIEHSGMSEAQKSAALKMGWNGRHYAPLEVFVPDSSPRSNKDASVVGRAVVGGIVAGPAGAVVGALSAVDKNNRSSK